MCKESWILVPKVHVLNSLHNQWVKNSVGDILKYFSHFYQKIGDSLNEMSKLTPYFLGTIFWEN